MTITLFKTQQGWMAAHSGRGSKHIIELFGTNVLPTAFSAQVPAYTVLVHIGKLNPSADVWLDRERDSEVL